MRYQHFYKLVKNVLMGRAKREMEKHEEGHMNAGSGCCFRLTWCVKVKHTYHTENTPQGSSTEALCLLKTNRFLMDSLINGDYFSESTHAAHYHCTAVSATKP